jgi:hypothetical protein
MPLHARTSGSLALGLMVAVACGPGTRALAQSSRSPQDRSVSLQDRFIHEAPPKWQEYQALMQKLQGKQETLVRRVKDKGKAVRKENTLRHHTALEIKQCGEWAQTQFTDLGAGPADEGQPTVARAWLVNSRYSARVKRDTNDGDWVLEELDQQLENGKPVKGPAVREQALGVASFLLRVESLTFAEITRSATFVLKEVKPVGDESPGLLRVSFSRGHPPSAPPEYPRMDGWVIVDPTCHWIITQGSLKVTYQGEAHADWTFKNDYRQAKGGPAIPKRSVARRTFPELGREEEVTNRFDFRSRMRSPKARFR